MTRLRYGLQYGMPRARHFDGKRYVFYFAADSKTEAMKAANELRRTGKWYIRIAKVKRGYNVYARNKSL